MTLNLSLLYWFWFVEYCQTSPNKNKSPNLWQVTNILVWCIFVRHCALKASRRGRNVKVDCQTLPLKCGAEWKTWPSVCTKYWVVYFSIKYLIWYSNPKEMNSINLASLGLMKKWFFNDAYTVYLMAKTLYLTCQIITYQK